MNKTIIFARSSVINDKGELYQGVEELLRDFNKQGDEVIIMSHNKGQISPLKETFDFIILAYRHQIRDYLKDNSSESILIGSNDDDLRIAASRKTALFVPMWADTQDDLPNQYGLKVQNPKMLFKILQIIKNQQSWFYELHVDEITTVYSLTSANSYGRNITKTEKEIVEGFNKLLKKGNKKYFRVLQYHFLAFLVHQEEFKKVDIWGMMPSSKGEYNEDLLSLKERARVLMGKKHKKQILVRHTKIEKSQHIKNNLVRLPCDRHFESMNLNPNYKGKLKNKVVCIIDDYSTNGTSFETVRNLLEKEKVKKIIFLSLGKFKRNTGIDYYKQDYLIEGDVYSNSYEYTLTEEENIEGHYNEQAREDIKNLYNIIFNKEKKA